jgi:thermostable 8-oxoguanine DNA glycosylase
LDSIPIHNDLIFRKWLLTIKGIGQKTASWITRNYLNSENVAIIDIHIFRAGLIAGFFSKDLDIQKDYSKIEQIFIQFCKALEVQPSKMDALMWLQMKESNRIALKTIDNH